MVTPAEQKKILLDLADACEARPDFNMGGLERCIIGTYGRVPGLDPLDRDWGALGKALGVEITTKNGGLGERLWRLCFNFFDSDTLEPGDNREAAAIATLRAIAAEL